MSDIVNFIDDFPLRCRDVLLLAHDKAKMSDREVTLTLMVASAGFLIPFERLRDDGQYIQPAQDRDNYPQAAAEFDQLLQQTWLESPFGKIKQRSWSSGPLAFPTRPVGEWPELKNLRPLPSTSKVGGIVTTIRHALAHGSIYTLPTLQKQIGGIVFVSGGVNRKTKRPIPYNYVHATPRAYHEFLLVWFERMDSWKVPQVEILSALERVA